MWFKIEGAICLRTCEPWQENRHNEKEFPSHLNSLSFILYKKTKNLENKMRKVFIVKGHKVTLNFIDLFVDYF